MTSRQPANRRSATSSAFPSRSSFVADLGQDSASHLIVDAVVHLVHGLGMAVVAEGVETAEQHHEVDRLGCDSCQGYYFARPMPATNLDTLIQPGIDGTGTHLPLLIAPAVQLPPGVV
jgi:predicted signal transduction protein with EAL and GGDEF domain